VLAQNVPVFTIPEVSMNKKATAAIFVAATFVSLMAGGNPVAAFSAGFFMKAVSAEFHWSRTVFSAGIFASMVLGALSLPIAGRLADRFGPKRVLLVAIFLFSGFTAALSLLNGNVVQFFVLFVTFGIASNLLGPTLYCRVVAGWTDRRRGLALALALSGNAVGAVVISLLGGYIIQQFGWRTAYLLLALYVFVLPFIAVTFFVQDPPSGSRSGNAGPGRDLLPGLTLKEAMRTKMFWVLTATLFFNGMGVFGLTTHGVPLLTERGVSAFAAATVLSAMGIAQLAGRLISGLLLDSTQSGRIAAAFFASAALGLAMIAFGGSSQPVLVIGAALVGAGLGADAELSAFFISRYFGLRSYATIYGVVLGSFLIGDAFGPLMFGVTYDAFGSYAPALKIAIAMVLLSVIGGLFFGRYVYTVRKDKAFEKPSADAELQFVVEQPR
jgi:MFS family permease